VSEVVRQLVPALPQILAQAQNPFGGQGQNPFGGMGYAAFGQAQRQLSPQDVNEVVRQILPIALAATMTKIAGFDRDSCAA
jgi:hypothetical protein